MKTALSSLRSTVSQQEVELKRLNETLEIRNKRITHLESQVGHASDIIADRVSPSNLSQDKLDDLCDKIKEISTKMERLQSSHPANSIVINSCHHNLPHTEQHSVSQTEHNGNDNPGSDHPMQDVGEDHTPEDVDTGHAPGADQPQSGTSL